MFSVIVIHEQGDASVFKAGIPTEKGAKILRTKSANKYAHETFIVMNDTDAAAHVADLNAGNIKFENGDWVPVVKPAPVAAKPEPKKTGGKKTIGQVPPNILHMIAVTTGNAHKQWVNIATRHYGYQAV